MMIIRILLSLILALCAAEPAYAKLSVVATLPWIGSLASEIGKERVKVKVLVKPGRDAHYVEARPSMILAVRSADILMYNGLDLETGYLPVLLESSRNRDIQPGMRGNFDCSRFIEVIGGSEKVDRSMGDVHPLGNPHYHFSPPNILAVAQGMAGLLSDMDGKNADFYRTSLSLFKERLLEKGLEWRNLDLKGKSFVAFHKYFEYLASDFGFSIAGYVEPKPGIPPSAAHAQKLVKLIKERGVTKILTTSYSNRKQVDFVAEKSGAAVVVLPHDVGSGRRIDDWFDLMDDVLKKLR